MTLSSKNFLKSEDIEWEDLGAGISRKILGWDNQIMMVLVKFEKGAIGSPHEHVHTQTSYCSKGKFEFQVGDKKEIINEGDGVYIPPNTTHGAICLEAGILIDVFSPVREDFLNGTVSYLRK